MKSIKKITPSLIAIIGISVAYALNYFYRNSYISRDVYKSIAEPLFYISLSLLAVSFFIIFVDEEIFSAWFKFTRIWIPVSVFIVLITPGDTGGGFMPSLIDKEMTAILMSGLFFIISLLIIVVKLVKLHWSK